MAAAVLAIQLLSSPKRPELLEMGEFGAPVAGGGGGRGVGGRAARAQLLFEHHEMPFPAFGGGGGLGGADGFGGTGEQNVMYNGAPRDDLEKKFGMRFPPDARHGRRDRGGLRLARGSPMLAEADEADEAKTYTYERKPDLGEDYYSAIQAPNKFYSQPWLRDGKFRDSVVATMQGTGGGSYQETGGAKVYQRNKYDENGMDGYEPDMSVADDCYDTDTEDCYRQVFDPETGYPRR